MNCFGAPQTSWDCSRRLRGLLLTQLTECSREQRKVYNFWRQFDQKPKITSGCPVWRAEPVPAQAMQQRDHSDMPARVGFCSKDYTQAPTPQGRHAACDRMEAAA
ncbi:TPA: hypothetical protein ACH3X3_012889 [Trebouxia sp. C0006]